MNEMVQQHGGMDIAPGMKANGAVALAFQSREMIETLAMMQMAKMSPRNEAEVRERLEKAAKNESLAVAADYIYAKGGTEVKGLSIRAAEAMARAYYNVDFGTREVQVSEKETQCMTFCWDMETNTRETEFFSVPHSRSKGVWSGGRRVGTEVVQITDQRELDEITRSRAARLRRSCILAVIPVDIQEFFEKECEKTLVAKIQNMVEKKGAEGGIREVIEGMLKKLEGTYKVTRCMVADRFQKKHSGNETVATNALYSLDNRQIVQLYRILAGLRDGIGVPSDYFKGASSERVDTTATGAESNQSAKEAIKARLKGKGGINQPPPPSDAPQGEFGVSTAKQGDLLEPDDSDVPY